MSKILLKGVRYMNIATIFLLIVMSALLFSIIITGFYALWLQRRRVKLAKALRRKCADHEITVPFDILLKLLGVLPHRELKNLAVEIFQGKDRFDFDIYIREKLAPCLGREDGLIVVASRENQMESIIRVYRAMKD